MVNLIINNEVYPYTLTRFPCGELNVSIGAELSFLLSSDKEFEIIIECYFEKSDDIITSLLLKDVIDSHNRFAKLYMPYFPSARQDRVTEFGGSFGLMVYVNMLRDFSEIITVDPHSSVLVDFFTNHLDTKLTVIPQDVVLLPTIQELVKDKTNIALLSPDKGAKDKVKIIQEQLSNVAMIECSKTRQPDGKLIGFEVPCSVKDYDEVVIIDDIIDGGGTFNGLAHKIKQINPKVKITLVATFGKFSKGKLTELIDNVYVYFLLPNSGVDETNVKLCKLVNSDVFQ